MTRARRKSAERRKVAELRLSPRGHARVAPGSEEGSTEALEAATIRRRPEEEDAGAELED